MRIAFSKYQYCNIVISNINSSLVIFTPLYTLVGFNICSPLQYFPFISIHNFHIISKIFFLLCFMLPFHCLRISVPSLNTRHYLQNVIFAKFSFNSKVFFQFHLSSRLFAIRFQAACFSCFLLSFRLGTLAPSYSWDSILLDWSSVFVFLAPFACRQFPLLPI